MVAVTTMRGRRRGVVVFALFRFMRLVVLGLAVVMVVVITTAMTMHVVQSSAAYAMLFYPVMPRRRWRRRSHNYHVRMSYCNRCHGGQRTLSGVCIRQHRGYHNRADHYDA